MDNFGNLSPEEKDRLNEIIEKAYKKPKTKAELAEELKATKKKVAELEHELAIEKQKDSFREACDLLKYMMDALQSAGFTHEEAFQFVITGIKGGMRL